MKICIIKLLHINCDRHTQGFVCEHEKDTRDFAQESVRWTVDWQQNRIVLQSFTIAKCEQEQNTLLLPLFRVRLAHSRSPHRSPLIVVPKRHFFHSAKLFLLSVSLCEDFVFAEPKI